MYESTKVRTKVRRYCTFEGKLLYTYSIISVQHFAVASVSLAHWNHGSCMCNTNGCRIIIFTSNEQRYRWCSGAVSQLVFLSSSTDFRLRAWQGDFSSEQLDESVLESLASVNQTSLSSGVLILSDRFSPQLWERKLLQSGSSAPERETNNDIAVRYVFSHSHLPWNQICDHLWSRRGRCNLSLLYIVSLLKYPSPHKTHVNKSRRKL